MANDKRFVAKNGLQAQNIAFVDSDKTNTITANMLSSDTLSFEGQFGQLFSIADSMNGTIFSVNDVSGIPSIEVDDDGEIRLAETFGHVLIGTDSSTDTAKHIIQVAGGFNADSATIDGSLTVSGQYSVPGKLYTDITTSGNSSTTLSISNSTPNISTAAQTYIRWVAHDVTYSSGPNSPTLAIGHTSGTISWTGSYNYPDASSHGAATTTDLFVGITSNHAPIDMVVHLWQTDTNDWVCFLHCNTNNSPYYFHGHATGVVPGNFQLSSGGSNNVTGLTGSLMEEFGEYS